MDVNDNPTSRQIQSVHNATLPFQLAKLCAGAGAAGSGCDHQAGHAGKQACGEAGEPLPRPEPADEEWQCHHAARGLLHPVGSPQ